MRIGRPIHLDLFYKSKEGCGTSYLLGVTVDGLSESTNQQQVHSRISMFPRDGAGQGELGQACRIPSSCSKQDDGA